jgi:hypothetical protein
MGRSKDRILYIGTANGLYRAEPNGGDEYTPQLLGLQGKGTVAIRPLVDQRDPRRLYAGTSASGVCRSEDGGETWQEVNDGILYKEMWSLAQHPTTGELFAGSGPSAVFKSADGGDTWTDLDQLRTLPSTKDWTFPRPPHVSHIKDFGFSLTDPLRILCPIEEGWLLRTTDGGKTWQNLQDEVEFDAHYVTVMPNDPAVVIMTSGDGAYRSLDGGEHFTQITRGLDRRYIGQIAVHPARPNVLLTVAAAVVPPMWRRPEGADVAIYRSENQGETWEQVKGGLPELITAGSRPVASDPQDPNAFCVGMQDGTVWLTEDGGDSFQCVVRGIPPVGAVTVAAR